MNAIKSSNKKMSIAIGIVAVALAVAVKSGLAQEIAAVILDLSAQGLAIKEIYKFIAKKYGTKIAALLGISSIGSVISNATGFADDRANVKKYYKIIRDYGKRTGGNGSGSW